MHGADVGVEPRTDILNVKNHKVYIRELFRSRFPVGAVKRHNGKPRLAVHTIVDLFAISRRTAEAMLRSKYFPD
jgi:hypothetical protein